MNIAITLGCFLGSFYFYHRFASTDDLTYIFMLALSVFTAVLQIYLMIEEQVRRDNDDQA